MPFLSGPSCIKYAHEGPVETAGGGRSNKNLSPAAAKPFLNGIIKELNEQHGTRIALFGDNFPILLESIGVTSIDLESRELDGFIEIATFLDGRMDGDFQLSYLLDYLPEIEAPIVKLICLKMFEEKAHALQEHINAFPNEPQRKLMMNTFKGRNRLKNLALFGNKFNRDFGYPDLLQLTDAIGLTPTRSLLVSALNRAETRHEADPAIRSLVMVNRLVVENLKLQIEARLAAATRPKGIPLQPLINSFLAKFKKNDHEPCPEVCWGQKMLVISRSGEDAPGLFDIELSSWSGEMDLNNNEVLLIPWFGPKSSSPARINLGIEDSWKIIQYIANNVFGTQPATITVETIEIGLQVLILNFKSAEID